MPFAKAGRAPVATALLPCFESLCRSPIAGCSRSTLRPITYTFHRTYAQPASLPAEDEDRSQTQSSNQGTGPTVTKRRGGMSDEERAKWAFPTKINPTPYDILHLPKTASKSEIKKHCKSLVPCSLRWGLMS